MKQFLSSLLRALVKFATRSCSTAAQRWIKQKGREKSTLVVRATTLNGNWYNYITITGSSITTNNSESEANNRRQMTFVARHDDDDAVAWLELLN